MEIGSMMQGAQTVLCDRLRSGMGWEAGRRFRRKGTYVYLWLIHADVWQKPTQYYKAIILQLKINTLIKNKNVNKLGQIYVI